MSCLLSGENESRNSANTGKLALFFQMQASSDPVSLQSDVSLSFALFGCNFTKNTPFPFNIQVRFMKVVNLIVYRACLGSKPKIKLKKISFFFFTFQKIGSGGSVKRKVKKTLALLSLKVSNKK